MRPIANRRRVSDNNNISQLLRDSFSVSQQPPSGNLLPIILWAGVWLGSIILLVVTPETRDKARARGWETDGVLVLGNLGHCGGV